MNFHDPFQNLNSMSGCRDISLQTWNPKWAKDDHFQWARFNHPYCEVITSDATLKFIKYKYLSFFSTMILFSYPNYVLRAIHELKKNIACNILNFSYENSE